MAYVAKFLDNQPVGVDDFNNIIADLCGEGVIPGDNGYNFETDTPYAIKKLNDITKDAVYSEGVVPSSETALKVSFDETSKTATINTGVAVFSSGLIFKVTETESVAYDPTADQYVYLVHDTSANTAAIGVASALPAENTTRFVVPLAQCESGTVTDRRKYAEGKLKCCANWNGTTKADFTYAGGTGGTWNEETVTVWDKGDEVNFIVFVSYSTSTKLSTTGAPSVYSISLVTETDGEFSILSIVNKDDADFFTDYAVLYSSGAMNRLYDFKHADGGITATLRHWSTYSSTQYPVEMYVSVVE